MVSHKHSSIYSSHTPRYGFLGRFLEPQKGFYMEEKPPVVRFYKESLKVSLEKQTN